MNSAVPSAPLTPKANGPKAPIRVAGNLRSPKAIVQAKPEYPVVARQAHIEEVVTVDAVLDEHGNVQEMKVLSGPPLLYQAALDALKKWKYEPTLIVTITFQLGQ